MAELAESDAAVLVGLRLVDLIPDIVLSTKRPDRPPEHLLLLPDGQFRPVEVLWRENLDGDGHVVAIRDLSRQKAAESRIEQLVRFDPLTGLANRSHFEQLLRKALARPDPNANRVVLHHIDLNRFENVNETIGPWAGEQVIIHAANRLNDVVRRSDVIARLGRTEFAIIQPLSDQSADAFVLAKQIVTEMAKPFSGDDQMIELSANVGIAVYPADCIEAADLVRNAALALRQAKLRGPGVWCHFEPAMDLALQTKLLLERDLRLALGENQFTLNYQPFVDIETRRTVGYEALLRWDHPTRGRIPPTDFIPVAEECGLIVAIGRWVLFTACAEAMSWPEPAIVSEAENLSSTC
jgi:diguanylate cyclase (GGDEF)-like protein